QDALAQRGLVGVDVRDDAHVPEPRDRIGLLLVVHRDLRRGVRTDPGIATPAPAAGPPAAEGSPRRSIFSAGEGPEPARLRERGTPGARTSPPRGPPSSGRGLGRAEAGRLPGEGPTRRSAYQAK